MAILGISGHKQSGKDTVAKIIQYLTTGGDKTYTNIQGFLEYYDDSKSPNAPKFPWQIKMFAGKVKDIVCLLINCTREQLENGEFKETPLGEEWRVYEVTTRNPENQIKHLVAFKEDIPKNYKLVEDYLLTPRKLLQLIGTECGRNIIHPNIWVTSLMQDYDTVLDNWIITDVRFKNEAEAIRAKGGLLFRIDRDIRYWMCDECGAEDIRGYEFKKIEAEDTCPRCLFRSEENLTMVIPDLDTHISETSLDNYNQFTDYIRNDGAIEDLVEEVKSVLIAFKII